jgi:hypothetical protein
MAIGPREEVAAPGALWRPLWAFECRAAEAPALPNATRWVPASERKYGDASATAR